MNGMNLLCRTCGLTLDTPSEQASGTCWPCALFPPRDDVPAVSEDVLLAIARKWFRIGRESAFRERSKP
jgi:hypothetical protein